MTAGVLQFPIRGATDRRRRSAPRPLAPIDRVTVEECVSSDTVAIVGRDLEDTMRIRIEVSREDATSWLFKVVRLWLMRRHHVTRIRLERVEREREADASPPGAVSSAEGCERSAW